ncbi:UvrD-helicase domain-containing protein [Acinetobacter sp. 194]|uniref:UvrD-helicase domain-containing protein n=1 Tax=Acinetobacter shaoyimingii TaxID=2715164 RepID=UPI00140E16C1|nr:UvrD-helicase domain-containing protein [Acinetobacter shaoyimingii]NHB56731.1 UvrD-helicase domain-containing protein [Acinetobacter shaoyimingii]
MNTAKISTQPIVDMQFSGLHWIEASAGTGKTYTLSSLMVRILLEKHLPNQVIATTFTRKAAAELKSRVRSRLQDTQRYFEACRELTEQQILAKAEQESDPLFAVLLKTFSTQIGYVCERLKLVIDQIDELFVGTLDSFSQKLLREFAFESGKIEYAQITDDAKKYSRQLIHDILREWIQQQSQHTIDYLLLNQKLKSEDAYVSVVENSLNFASAHFQPVITPDFDVQAFQKEVDQFIQLDLSQVQSLSDFYAPDGQHHKVLAKKWRDDLKLQRLLHDALPALIEGLKQQGVYALFAPQYASTLKAFQDLSKKPINKCPEDVLNSFEQHPVICAITHLNDCIQQLSSNLEQLDSHLKYHLAHQVKIRLPQVLQQKGETTFAQQIRTLASALQGTQGQRFAAYVHARYPLILVDEFQDTNQDQDDMLAQIWRHPNRVKQGCMIMVGDRKQAIYGFRGGDMLTFLKAHQDVFGKDGHAYNLVYNHRSVQPLVEVVDALFQRQIDFGEAVFYTPVQAGSRPHPALIEDHQANPAPLRWMQLEDKEKEAEQVAWKIRDLLNQGIAGKLFVQDQQAPQAIQERDIAVLSKNHNGLDQVQSALEFLGIQVNRPSKKSVFESQIARDVGALLTAILHPYDEAKVKRALVSRLFGFNLQKLIQLELQADGLSSYIEQFDQIREMWLNQGFLTAWQYALAQFKVWKTLVEKQSRDNERVVVNLRHLTEVLSQHSEVYQGAHNLYHWYLKQLTQPMEREWEMERQLSNDAGVQLMTIHQSKGLEFKIVFLLGADKSANEQNKTLNFSKLEQLNPVTGKVEEQRVVAINDKQNIEPQALAQHEERVLAEHRRLWYVALTRASHRVYAMLSDVKGTSTTGLAFWRGQGADAFQHPFSVNEPLLLERPKALQSSQNKQQQPVDALDFPSQRFYPRGKTSFSYLAQHLTRQQIQDAMAVAEPEIGIADDEKHQSIDSMHLALQIDIEQSQQQDQPLAWIKSNFPMGTFAGSFLHKIFEHIDFKNQHNWGLEIRRRFKNDNAQLWNEVLAKVQTAFPQEAQHEDFIIEQVKMWMNDVLSTPILNSFCLNQLEPHEHLAEFPFYLALSDRVLAIQRIHQLFAEYDIHMPEFLEANSARYLKGEIDLVFFDGQRYHIADYKSNFLGTQQQHYNSEAIQESMSHASYWLQAALYLVALHRYLKIQLEDYEISRDLGGASYLYLRGMNGQAGQGYFYWQPETEFILRLDAILGHFAEDKNSKIA